jgi:hypothetical protein
MPLRERNGGKPIQRPVLAVLFNAMLISEVKAVPGYGAA